MIGIRIKTKLRKQISENELIFLQILNIKINIKVILV